MTFDYRKFNRRMYTAYLISIVTSSALGGIVMFELDIKLLNLLGSLFGV